MNLPVNLAAKKIGSLALCGFALTALATTIAYGQGEILPIEPMPAANAPLANAPSVNPPSPKPETSTAEPVAVAPVVVAPAELEYLRRAAGLTALVGPGVKVILRDRSGAGNKRSVAATSGLVHDYDLISVINELREARAEAIAINGLRVGGQTAIGVAGASIRVGNTPLKPPFEVAAIGDAALMKKNLAESAFAKSLKNGGPQMTIGTAKTIGVPALKEAPIFRFGSPQ